MDIVETIKQLGFPIACCIAVGWYTVTKGKSDQSLMREMMANHKAEIDLLQSSFNSQITKITEALNNNTLVLQRLCDKLDLKGE